MYIAGIHLDLPSDRVAYYTEVGVWSIVALAHASVFSTQYHSFKRADEQGGPIKRLPTTTLGKIITPLHGAAMFLPPFAYLVSVPFNGFEQPAWFAQCALPDGGLGAEGKAVVRAGACVALALGWGAVGKIMKILDSQFHYIGVREKPKIINTGPYAYVRHPLYSVALLQGVVYSGVLWSYIPLAASVITTIAFLIKIPIEEQLLESDEKIGAEYREYKKEVPYKLIPYVL